MIVDIAAVESLIAEVGQTEIMPRFRKLAEGDVEMKGANDPVTVADKAAEMALIAGLTKILPGSVIVGEESVAADPTIVERFSGDDYVWVIDPIDGTRNFISGTPEFGVMVGLVRRKETVAGWIHDPNSGDTLMAEKGGGVYMRGHKMRLAARERGADAVGLIGSRLNGILKKHKMATLLHDLPVYETGSAAAFDYGRLFTGPRWFGGSNARRASFLLYRMSKPWDHVPGLLLLSETGGYAADLEKGPYDMESGKRGLLLAGDQDAWTRIHQAFNPALEILLKK